MAEKKLDLFIEDELTDEFLEEFCCQAHIEKREFDDWHIDRQRNNVGKPPRNIFAVQPSAKSKDNAIRGLFRSTITKNGTGTKSMIVAAQIKICPEAQVSGQVLKDAFIKSRIPGMMGIVHNVDIDTDGNVTIENNKEYMRILAKEEDKRKKEEKHKNSPKPGSSKKGHYDTLYKKHH